MHRPMNRRAWPLALQRLNNQVDPVVIRPGGTGAQHGSGHTLACSTICLIFSVLCAVCCWRCCCRWFSMQMLLKLSRAAGNSCSRIDRRVTPLVHCRQPAFANNTLT